MKKVLNFQAIFRVKNMVNNNMKIGMKNLKSNSIISLKIRKVVKLLNLDFGSFISIINHIYHFKYSLKIQNFLHIFF